MANNTNLLVYKTQIYFSINGFKECTQRQRSEEFSIGSNRWQLSVNPEFRVSGSPLNYSYVGVGLHLIDSLRTSIDARILLYIVDCDYQPINRCNRRIKDTFTDEVLTFSWERFIRRQSLLESSDHYLPNNRLTIGLTIELYEEVIDYISTGLDYKSSFNNKNLNDFKITVGEKTYYVSKAVLSLHSTEFRAMFLSTKTNLVIEAFDRKVFETFLSFAYFAKLDKINELAEDLLVFCVKFKVKALQTICENLIYISINPLNAIKKLILFNEYECQHMKRNCIQYMARNMDLIRRKNSSEEWLELVRTDYQLVDDIIDVMAEQLPKEEPNCLKTLSYNYCNNSFAKIIVTIDDFDAYIEPINTSKFAIGLNKWFISVDTNYSKNNKNFLRIELFLDESNESEVKAKYEVFIVDIDGTERNKKCETFCEYKPKSNVWKSKPFLRKDLLLSKRDTLLAENKLTLGFNIIVRNNKFNFENTFNVKELNDLRIIVGRKEFFVSKALMSSRSPVFKAMLLNDMKEKQTNEVVIEDIESDVFEEFLQLIYFGKSDKFEEMKVNLLLVCDKYQVSDLKTICEKLIFFAIKPNNAIKMLKTFDSYYFENIKNKVIEYMTQNINTIRSEVSDEWINLVKTDYQLIDQIIEVMARNADNTESTESQTSFKAFTYQYFDKTLI